MIFTFQTPTIPGTGAPPLTPYSAPASTNTTPLLIGASFAGMSPQTGIANSRTESSIPLKKRTLTNESTSSGGGGGGVGLSKQISNETNPSLESISLIDWQKHRVLALKQPSSQQQQPHRPHQRRRNPSSASHHHHYEDEDDAAFADDDSNAMFLDFYPAVIENTNGAFVTVTFAHNNSSSAAAATTAANAASAAPTHAHSAASADDPASSSLVLSQSLPNLSMLASQAYDYILLSLNYSNYST